MSSEDHPLSKAFSADMTPENLDKARKDVGKQLSRAPKPPQAEEAEEAEGAEGDEEIEVTEEETGSKDAPEYVADLNNVSDVLLILVGKYTRLSKLLYVSLGLLVIGVGLIVKAGFEIDHLQASQADLQRELRKATEEVAEAKQAVKDTGEAVKDTTEAVKEAAEAAPKAVYDADAGTAKIVIPVVKCEGDAKKCDKLPKEPEDSKKPKSGSKKPKGDDALPPPAPPSTGQTVPLNPKVGIQGEEGF